MVQSPLQSMRIVANPLQRIDCQLCKLRPLFEYPPALRAAALADPQGAQLAQRRGLFGLPTLPDHGCTMRINLFDDGLREVSGHHFDYCHRIANSLTRRGFSVSVWGACGAQEELSGAFDKIGCSFFQLFSHFSYDPLALDGKPLERLEAITRRVASELASAAPADACIFPTLTSLAFAGFCWLEHPVPMIGMVHQEPNFEHPYAGRLWATAADTAMQRGLTLALGVIDPLVGDFLRTYGADLPFIDLPVPLGAAAKVDYADRIGTVGFFGYQREERGIALIAPLADELLRLGHKVVIHDTMGHFSMHGAIAKLRLVNAFVDDLGHEMATCDLVVCLMQWHRYLRRSSGIVCTGIAAGVPLVMPSGTLSAMRFHAFGSISCYQEHTLDGVMQAIHKMSRNYPTYVAGAKRGAIEWNRTHGLERYVDRVVEYLESNIGRRG